MSFDVFQLNYPRGVLILSGNLQEIGEEIVIIVGVINSTSNSGLEGLGSSPKRFWVEIPWFI